MKNNEILNELQNPRMSQNVLVGACDDFSFGDTPRKHSSSLQNRQFLQNLLLRSFS